ncbi:MAG: hypothetical protein P8Z79_04930 [Sedimentisphaerales bacterium]|jgi:hypothetical protein
MNTPDTIKIRYRAKIETETFINRHLNDGAKGWPRLCAVRPVGTSTAQKQQTIRRTG